VTNSALCIGNKYDRLKVNSAGVVVVVVVVAIAVALVVAVVVVSLIITLSTAKLHQLWTLKIYEIKYNISLNDVHTWQ